MFHHWGSARCTVQLCIPLQSQIHLGIWLHAAWGFPAVYTYRQVYTCTVHWLSLHYIWFRSPLSINCMCLKLCVGYGAGSPCERLGTNSGWELPCCSANVTTRAMLPSPGTTRAPLACLQPTSVNSERHSILKYTFLHEAELGRIESGALLLLDSYSLGAGAISANYSHPHLACYSRTV